MKKRQSIHFIVLFLYSNYTVRYQIIYSKENSPYHQKNFCFFIKPNSFLINKISCHGVKKLASTRKKTKFLVVISLRMQVFPITTIRFKNPAKISRFVYSTHSLLTHAQTNVPSVVGQLLSYLELFLPLPWVLLLHEFLSKIPCHSTIPFAFHESGRVLVQLLLLRDYGQANQHTIWQVLPKNRKDITLLLFEECWLARIQRCALHTKKYSYNLTRIRKITYKFTKKLHHCWYGDMTIAMDDICTFKTHHFLKALIKFMIIS